MNPALRALKNTVRKDVRKRLAALSVEEIDRQSAIVTEKLLSLKVYKESQNVSVYISMHGEINTREIIRDLLAQSKNPNWKIPEPKLDEVREDALKTQGLDLIIMPGLAFDAAGTRLGHGRGYYDNYLLKANEFNKSVGKPLVATVALALSEQMTKDLLPRCETDINPQQIIFP
ncbi:hypothetical protein DFQ27_007813 [Actinomortierella ambigua]|uniref:5-formyltetrahydrofolate cyclo-ligase n=1 Tax=Actinomortierella ambigua TaxID=1343610 RepID=A0A9P6TZ61_9FUNG|nr:hypothetical protein DFQ26_008087 [Actinomortierella ambigua]KAG0252837.1 hypothetical protein DFQ27_007813 [Actinomortierella ambigua]